MKHRSRSKTAVKRAATDGLYISFFRAAVACTWRRLGAKTRASTMIRCGRCFLFFWKATNPNKRSLPLVLQDVPLYLQDVPFVSYLQDVPFVSQDAPLCFTRRVSMSSIVALASPSPSQAHHAALLIIVAHHSTAYSLLP